MKDFSVPLELRTTFPRTSVSVGVYQGWVGASGVDGHKLCNVLNCDALENVYMEVLLRVFFFFLHKLRTLF